MGPPWPPPEPSGAEARAVLLLGPDRAGPRTSRPRLRAAVGAVLGPGACRGARFREVWLAGSRNGAGEAEECGGFGFCPTFAFVGPRGRGCDLSSGLVDSPGLEERTARVPTGGLAFPLRLLCELFSALRAKLLTLGRSWRG